MWAPNACWPSHRPSTKIPPAEVFATLKVDSFQRSRARLLAGANRMGNLKPEYIVTGGRMFRFRPWLGCVDTVRLGTVHFRAQLETGGHSAPHHHQRYAIQRGRNLLQRRCYHLLAQFRGLRYFQCRGRDR